MEKFKMSQFVGNKKTIRYINGRVITDTLKPINGAIILNDFDKDLTERIAKALPKTKNNVEVYYKILPCITNVEMDITLKEFNDLMANNLFKEFMEIINKSISEVIKAILSNMNRTKEIVKLATPKLNNNKEDVKREVLTDDNIEDLLKELSNNALSEDKKKEIIKKINNSSDEK